MVRDYPVTELLLLRSVGAILLVGPLAFIRGSDFKLRGSLVLHTLRVVFLSVDSFCFYFATRSMPLADVMTFYMAAPILLTAISGAFLGERVGAWRWSAVLVGFAGVVVALNPTGVSVSGGAVIALFGAVLFAIELALTRKLSSSDPAAMVFWQFIGAAILGGAGSCADWITPGWFDAGLMVFVGVIAAASFGCVAQALALAPASVLAPFQYSSILWASLLGWIVWMDIPTINVIVGNAILIASGLFVIHRERRRVTCIQRGKPGEVHNS